MTTKILIFHDDLQGFSSFTILPIYCFFPREGSINIFVQFYKKVIWFVVDKYKLFVYFRY